jgi:hypothetical protein
LEKEEKQKHLHISREEQALKRTSLKTYREVKMGTLRTDDLMII